MLMCIFDIDFYRNYDVESLTEIDNNHEYNERNIILKNKDNLILQEAQYIVVFIQHTY